MCHNRNTSICNSLNLRTYCSASLQLNSIGPAFLHQAACIHYGLLYRHLIRHKWHINNHHSIVTSSSYSMAKGNHILHSNGNGIRQSQHNISQRVPYQNTINASFLLQLGGGVIITGKHGNLLTLLLHLQKGCYCILHNISSFPTKIDSISIPFEPAIFLC